MDTQAGHPMRATGPPSGSHGRLVVWARRTVRAAWFGHGVTAAITVNAVVIGLDTSVALAARFAGAFDLASKAFLAMFVVEALIKMAAVWPRLRDYFADPWNMFDFAVIVVSLVPSTGGLATLARLVRLFRVLRLMSALPELQLIVSTLIRSVPGMFNVLALMSIVFYVYGVAGYHLFRELDPDHWRTLGISLLSLFRIATLEDWTDIMYAALEHHWWAWVYFVSFVVVETFVVLNLFVAVVINSLEEAKHDRKQEIAASPTRAELLADLSQTREALGRLEERLQRN
ncbi:MAG: ion transporter [Bryobacterales bacterium]|nr:ion transporter [Bryobacterales bacterium]